MLLGSCSPFLCEETWKEHIKALFIFFPEKNPFLPILECCFDILDLNLHRKINAKKKKNTQVLK